MKERRLSPKEILDYAQGSPYKFIPGVAPCPLACPEGLSPEGCQALYRDWYSLRSMEVVLSRLKAAEALERGQERPAIWRRPNQWVEGFHEGRDLRRKGEAAPRACYAPPPGEHYAHAVEVEGVMILMKTSEDQRPEDMRREALALVVEKLSEYSTRARFQLEGRPVRTVRLEEPSFIFQVWDTVRALFEGEIEVKQCIYCGKWEVKGEGFKTTKWTAHQRCGTRARVRGHRRSVAARDRAELETFLREAERE